MIDHAATDPALPGRHAWRVTPLRAGGFRLDGGGMFGLIPKTMWSGWTPPDASNRIALACNALLLEDGSMRVLVEAGYGAKWSAKERAVYELEERTVVDALRERGLGPESIDQVIVTHLHFDHAAGLTELDPNGVPRPVFPRAPILVQEREWEDAVANRSTMTRTYLRTHLDPVRELVRPVHGSHEVLPGILVRPLPGHTWGQQGVFVRTAEGILVFPGDLMPTAHHVHLAANMGYDMLPYENMLQKRAFLREAADGGWTIALDHDPSGTLVRAHAEDAESGRFRLERLA
jgi:glyoxylase-like metal-dependent hydrolase (beta-lactamase superfamily II)